MQTKTMNAVFPNVEVVVTPTNDRALLTLTGRGWTLIDAYLTNDEIAALTSALTAYALSNVPAGSEFKVGV